MLGKEGDWELTATTIGISIIFDSPLTSSSCADANRSSLDLYGIIFRRLVKLVRK